MLVATPGQTTSYSIVHNNSSNGGGGGSTATAAVGTAATKKSSATLNPTNTIAPGAAKALNNSNNNTSATVTTKNSLISNSTTSNYHANSNINIASNKISNQHKAAAATSSRDNISSTITATSTTHSLKNENSTNTTTTKQQSFIQTLKDSVQKALISTTGGSSSSSNNNNKSIYNKYSTDNKLQQNNCNNNSTTSTSIHNVTSSSSSSTHNAHKVSTTATTTTTSSTTTFSTSKAATQSTSSGSVGRSKYNSCSLSKLHTVAPTVLHRYPEERQQASSTDSLQKEMCHFKPIRVVAKTPWKSGSKSRGSSLRFPKASLATKKIEFILKSNCDVNNRKKKQQQNRTQNDKINLDEDDFDVDDNEQENKKFYGIYRPKPSLICLSTTPNHKSAFVCLVTQMKSLISLQSKRQQTGVSAGGVVEVETTDKNLKELYMKKNPPTKRQQNDLPSIDSSRLSLNAVKNKSLLNETDTATSTQQANTKDGSKRKITRKNNISKASTMAITKSRSRKNLGRAKSKTVNSVELAAATKAKQRLTKSASMPAVSTATQVTRKRKIAQDIEPFSSISFSLQSSPIKSTSIKSLALGARKSTRLSIKAARVSTTNTNRLFKEPINSNKSQESTIKSSKTPLKHQTSVASSFSPPLTRSRLKLLAEQGKILRTITPADISIKRQSIQKSIIKLTIGSDGAEYSVKNTLSQIEEFARRKLF